MPGKVLKDGFPWQIGEWGRGKPVSEVQAKSPCRQTRWSTCHISGQPLEVPIAADFLGTLYNKEAVLEFLLARNGYFADQEAEVPLQIFLCSHTAWLPLEVSPCKNTDVPFV